jgi:serine/threonine protein kinase
MTFVIASSARGRQARRPKIEDYLLAPDAPEYKVLLEQLILLDVEYRQAAGESPHIADYADRFSSVGSTWFDAHLPQPPTATTAPPATDQAATVRYSGPKESGAVEGRLDPHVPAISVPGFQVLSLIGKGGMGAVFKARSLANDQIVALKIILDNTRANVVGLARFRLEAEAVSCLGLPNVVKILGFGLVDECPYMLLEYVSGGSLAAKIGRSPQLPRWSAEITFHLATTLEKIHQRGIIHRDLKPGNVLLSTDGSPMITDFGLAKFCQPFDDVVNEYRNLSWKVRMLPDEIYDELLDRYSELADADSPVSDRRHEEFEQLVVDSVLGELSPSKCLPDLQGVREPTLELLHGFRRRAAARASRAAGWWQQVTEAGQVVGTPCYMAPEQALGGTTGPRTDVYGLGAILYQMLTGRPPFAGSKPLDVLQLVTDQRPDPIEEPVAPDLAAICMKCLEKKTDRRYQSAGELAKDLQRFLDGYAAHAPRDRVSKPTPDSLHTIMMQEELLTDSRRGMKEQPGSNPGSVPLSLQAPVDQVREHFDALWKTGQRPRLEEYLADVSEPKRRELFRQLLPLKVELRRAAHEWAMGDDYVQRFPEYIALIRDVFERDARLRPEKTAARGWHSWHPARRERLMLVTLLISILLAALLWLLCRQ